MLPSSNLPLAQCKRKTSMIICVKRIDIEDQSNSVVLFTGLLFQVNDPDKVSCATPMLVDYPALSVDYSWVGQSTTPMLAPTLLLIKYGSSDSPRWTIIWVQVNRWVVVMWSWPLTWQCMIAHISHTCKSSVKTNIRDTGEDHVWIYIRRSSGGRAKSFWMMNRQWNTQKHTYKKQWQKPA